MALNRQKITKLNAENSDLLQQLSNKDTLIQQIKTEFANLLKQQKNENINMMNNFESEFNILKKENLALELQLKGKLDQEQKNTMEVENMRKKNESTT